MNNSSKFGEVAEYTDELRQIVAIVKQLRILKAGKKTVWEKAAEWHMKYSNLYGAPALALTVTLSPTGCEWARKGGCTMCGEFEGAAKRKEFLDNPQFHIAQFSAAVSNEEVWETARRENKPISWLRINQEGNFTNPNEMCIEAREVILKLAMRIKGIKRITIESRPQYLDEDTLSSLADIFHNSGVELEIGMGLEAEDLVVRNVCINKQGTNKQFIDTVQLLKKYNILPLAYVLLKPPFLTESEAIDEAVTTAHFAADIGFSRISFEPLSIHQYTLVDLLKNTGAYKAPWLWSVIEVAKRCADISNIFGIGGIGYYPIPTEYAHNYCEKCNVHFLEMIKLYNQCRDVSVFDSLKCDCYEKWRSECSMREIPFKQSMQEQLKKAEDILHNYIPNSQAEDMYIREKRIISGNVQI